MCVAFTAYGYDSSFKNGGKGVKLGFYRTQGERVAKKQLKESSHDENVSIHFDGEIIREKGNAYLIDCNVTGSDEGKADKTKFSLMSLFRDHIFPKALDLASKGSDFKDYIPVFQGDNAGPHIDATYHNFFRDYCREKGWRWDPQAPQMIHMNNLDLTVLTKTPKDHIILQQQHSNKMAPPEEIWKTAKSVWRNMDSAFIARGFILAYRNLQKVIDNSGTNKFHQGQYFHSGVCDDSVETHDLRSVHSFSQLS